MKRLRSIAQRSSNSRPLCALAWDRQTVMRYLNGGEWELLGDFTEIETGKGANALDKHPQLKAALDA